MMHVVYLGQALGLRQNRSSNKDASCFNPVFVCILHGALGWKESNAHLSVYLFVKNLL